MADVTYPSSLPCPQLSDYQLNIDYGMQAVTFENGHRRQRKAFKQKRMVFSLSFVLTNAQLWTWQSWANKYGYDWHWMNLESNFSGAVGSNVSGHYIRYITDIAIEPVDHKYFRVVVQAEMDLNTTPQGAIAFTGNWIVGGTPAAPAANFYVGQTPSAPSTDFIIAGTPEAPAA